MASDRVKKLIQAFKKDSFTKTSVFGYNGKIGITAEYTPPPTGKSKVTKKAYYIEGSPYEMGYLMGWMAEPDISRMCTVFIKRVLLSFIDENMPAERKDEIGGFLDDVMYVLSISIKQDIPGEYLDELDGMLDGCKEANPTTQVNEKALLVMTVGFDAILSFVYTFNPPIRLLPGLLMENLRIPLMCNGFSAFGTSPKPYHYMGRDFMFATGDTFHETAAMVICRPDNGLMFVSQAAPGIIGSITGMNEKGIGIGVQMAPSDNCDSNRPGFNSLLLNRHVVQYGENFRKALDLIEDAQRGVSWIYILSSGSEDKACIVEAGAKKTTYFHDYIPKNVIPQDVSSSIARILTTIDQLYGLQVRDTDYPYPDEYQKFNKPMIEDFKSAPYKYYYTQQYKYTYDDKDFGHDGMLDKTWNDNNCPMSYYFAPIRYNHGNLVVATNHFITPEMRLCAMSNSVNIVAARHWDDSQWRYDVLVGLLKNALDVKKSMDFNEAGKIIDFLAPYGQFPDYYNPEKKNLDDVIIEGSVSVLDLKNRVIKSHYGCYSDDWVTITLDNYL
ncbi:MAG: carcinine hydrolase/isopenicillin-N N-acyltransferase family protein [Candidatus Magnetominusculus sp. LBB02]|nr:carcinine hydrolase/isopenicillin-N N-acyltransferase family protein [Candidatus Magnetominusculus sp. LBB02]